MSFAKTESLFASLVMIIIFSSSLFSIIINEKFFFAILAVQALES